LIIQTGHSNYTHCSNFSDATRHACTCLSGLVVSTTSYRLQYTLGMLNDKP